MDIEKPITQPKKGFFRRALHETAKFVTLCTLAFITTLWICATVLLCFIFITLTTSAFSLFVLVVFAGGGNFTNALDGFNKWVDSL